ncbi:Fur-regulated basic protein FbpA [Priestia megaterium]|uniref:Fur-regulated basic protein FbpA n=1 Tax=Priestia megaterium TaxID=1404 RepID=UPI00316C6DE5
MNKQYQPDMDSEKNIVIDYLLDLGIYKKGTKQLYELTLTELEKEYHEIKQQI